MTIRTKVLLVTAIPLVPLAVLGTLIMFGSTRDRAAQARVARALEVRGAIHNLSALISDSELAARSYVLAAHFETLRVVENATSALPSQYAQLSALVADDPEQHDNVRRLLELDRERPTADLLQLATDSSGDHAKLSPALARSRSSMEAIRTHIAAMLAHEDVALARWVAAADGTRRMFSVITLGGMLLVVAATLFAGIALTRKISTRLERLRSDASRLASGHVVPQAPKSSDEIGELAGAIHQTSLLLSEREQLLRSQFEELASTRRELTQFFNLSLDMLCIAGTDGRFRKMNRAWTTTLGWTREELEGKPFLSFVHPDDAAATIAETASLASGQVTVSFENRYRCKDGGYRWLSWKAVAEVSTGSIYAAARDVTTQREVQEQLRRAQEEAERASRAKSEFVSRMSHEMRTPLNAVLGFAQLLEAEPLSREQLESVQLISRGGRHLLNLIDEVLDISRMEAGQLSLSPEAVDLAEVVGHTIALIAPLAAAREVTLKVEPAEHRYVVHADRQRLSQLLLNLLSNAVKYNRRGGHVTVHFAPGRDRRHARVLVTDTGLGIAPDKLARLFMPFERLGAESSGIEGTGLGLAVSRGLAEAMGGDLTVASEVGAGSTFAIELVLTDAAVITERSPRGAAVDADASVVGDLLYIEDNPSNVRLMQRILQRRPGIVLHAVSSGRDGIETAARMLPHLVFLDLHLPDLHGRDVLRELKTNVRLASIPVVVLSADATPAQRREMLAAGAVTYLTKPLDVAKVLATVDALVSQFAASHSNAAATE